MDRIIQLSALFVAGVISTSASALPIPSVLSPNSCVDVRAASPMNGTPVQIYHCNGTNAQDWTFTQGTIQALGKCLSSSGTTNGSTLVISDCDQGDDQKWTVSGNLIQLTGTNKCIDIPASNTADSTQLVLWDCHSGLNQQWNVPPPVGVIQPGLNTNSCLDVRGGSAVNGTAIQLVGCNGSKAQEWTFRNDGTIRAFGKCLSDPNFNTTNGTTLNLWDCGGGRDQNWVFDGKMLRLVGTGKCIDVPNGNTVDGTQPIIWDCNNTPNQQWLFTKTPVDPITGGSGKYNKLVWSDEFNGAGSIDPNKWNIEVNCSGGGNQEWQCYTNKAENLYQDGKGSLVIQLIKQWYGRGGYTSGRMNTSGKGDWTYGRFEGRMKIPAGQGTWPAFWMMPTQSVYGGWPTSGELDIMEILGQTPSRLYGTSHYGKPNPYTQAGGIYNGPDFSKEFHIYTLERDAAEIRWYIDNKLFFSIRDSERDYWVSTQWSGGTPPSGAKWPFNEKFHMILNFAMGGNWPGDPDPNINGGKFEVDYVRVYQ